MTQTALKLDSKASARAAGPATTEIVGLLYDDESVTLRFMETLDWGQPVRQVKLGRDLAEQLQRLLSDELEDASWA
jgi:hypothetical protein